jgi:hypothetical protein
MRKQVLLAEPEWSEIRAQAGIEKGGSKMGDLVAALERAARKEQEELKLKIRPQVEVYRKLTAHGAKSLIKT